MIPNPDRHQEMREALRELCAQFPPEYHRRHDQSATYPVEFIDALTKAGWLAAMIPEDYGGAGLGLTEATVVMEEINRSGGSRSRGLESGSRFSQCSDYSQKF